MDDVEADGLAARVAAAAEVVDQRRVALPGHALVWWQGEAADA